MAICAASKLCASRSSRSLEHCSLSLNHLAEVDAEIMVELLDVVISRYNRSQRTARAYHLALMQLPACALGGA